MSLWVVLLPCVVWAAGNEQAWYAPSTKFVGKTDTEALPKTAIDLCTLPPDIGGCTKELIRYYYDSKQDDCRRFIFTGCGGNSNRFMRRAHCRNRCVNDKSKTPPKDDVITRVPALMHTQIHHEKESKPHRRTLTTPPPVTKGPETTSTKTRSTTAPPITRAPIKFHATETPLAIHQCPHCDPLFGVCVDGECGCIPGFRKLGRICVDIDECQAPASPCPANTYCENTVGSFKCDCASGFGKGEKCEVVKEGCDDEFDVNLTEEDCNHGRQIVRYYLDKESNTCKEFFYGGCRSRSRNMFENLETCQQICAHKIAQGAPKSNSNDENAIVVNPTMHVDLTMQPTHSPLAPSDTHNVEEAKPNNFIEPRIESHSQGIPEKFRIDMSEPSPTPKLTSEEQLAEVKKVEEIVSDITPELDPCQVDFDEVLRLECITAAWEERFFWNRDLDECEPFWYDSSCDPKDTVGRNFYSSYESCQQRCNTGKSEPLAADNVQVSIPAQNEEKSPEIPPEVEVPTDSTKHPLHYLKDVEENFPAVTERSTPVYQQQLEPEVSENSKASETQGVDPNDPMGLLSRVPTTSSTSKPSTTTEFSLPPPHSSNFVTSAPLVIFDRAKYMAEFKKRLMELPAGKTTPATPSGLSFNGLGASVPRTRALFTLPPSALGGPESVQAEPVATVLPVENVQNEKEQEIQPALEEKAVETSKQPTIIEGNSVFLKFAEGVNKRPRFTLAPSVFEAEPLTTTISNPEAMELDKTRYETVENQDGRVVVDEIRQIEQVNNADVTTTSSPLDFVTQEKVKIESAIHEMNQLPDLCDEPLHPTLEEDCMNEQWVIRWFFNADRGACKTFWYGGCATEARNFFKDSANCNAACAHKIPVSQAALRPKYMTNPLTPQTTQPQDTVARKHILVTPVLPPFRKMITQKEGPASQIEAIAPDRDLPIIVPYISKKEIEVVAQPIPVATPGTATKVQSTTTTTEKPFVSYETSQAIATDDNVFPMELETQPPATENAPVQKETMRTTAEICAFGYDEQWDEDCSGDNWEVKSYYDPKAKKCKKFWWGGCMTSNQNVWKDQQTCVEMCAPPEPTHPPFGLHPGMPRTIRDNASGGDTQRTQDSSATQPNPEQPSTMIISESLLSDNSEFNSIDEKNRIDLDVPSSASKSAKERPLSDEASHEWHASPHRPRRKFSLKVRAALVETRYDKRRRNPHYHHGRDAVERSNAAGDGDWRLMNDAPADDQPEVTHAPSASPEASGPAFEADVQRQLAGVKRDFEDREDFKYSNLHQHPVTVASECLEIFDVNITKPCNGGTEWTNRYYFNPDIRSCQMFWTDGCFSSGRNNFADLETCQWKCEGRHPEPNGKSCLDTFDYVYKEDCNHGDFKTRFYFDHYRKRCAPFTWGGGRSSSENFFVDMGECQDLCEMPPRQLVQACNEDFDREYLGSCAVNGQFQQNYYFDHSTRTCKMFWFGGCKGENQNIFPSLETCQWICERHREERAPAHCSDRFDPKYEESCGIGEWKQRWYFELHTGECSQFWWDGCVAESQNIFPSEESCKDQCIHPGYSVESRLPDPESRHRCLEPVEIGTCKEAYPAFYYDRTSKVCRAFAYSGCGGNANRFLTQTQCEGLCYQFNDMADTEMDCNLLLHVGFGQNDDQCLSSASYRYYYDREYGRCSQFWYIGCGGNANNFHSYDVCQRVCKVERRSLERKTRASSHVCFKPHSVKGVCPSKISRTVQRFSYHNGKCVQFTYSGCGGSDNRFATVDECTSTCGGRKPSADANFCSFPPEVGNCNQLHYKWFYNETRGTCDQFLYGGCDGNTNRFDSFEECQKKCEVSGIDPCLESLDRGNWCEAMSNRYYFNKKSKQCRGFHYTGCGKSGNNFLSYQECHQKCELRYPKKRAAQAKSSKKTSKTKLVSGYSGVKPILKTPMVRHIVLNGSNRTYYKSEPEWIDYNMCTGYRYNISGRDTVLSVHLCSLNGNADCFTEILEPTDGEEYCKVLRPFLRGTHLYSWYFGLDVKEPPYVIGTPSSGRVQRNNETIATILQLKTNNCFDIC